MDTEGRYVMYHPQGHLREKMIRVRDTLNMADNSPISRKGDDISIKMSSGIPQRYDERVWISVGEDGTFSRVLDVSDAIHLESLYLSGGIEMYSVEGKHGESFCIDTQPLKHPEDTLSMQSLGSYSRLSGGERISTLKMSIIIAELSSLWRDASRRVELMAPLSDLPDENPRTIASVYDDANISDNLNRVVYQQRAFSDLYPTEQEWNDILSVGDGVEEIIIVL